MVKEIIRDPVFLRQKSEPATEEDRQIIMDFSDVTKVIDDKCSLYATAGLWPAAHNADIVA